MGEAAEMSDDLYKPIERTHYYDLMPEKNREHIPSVDCWCKPYPADDDELVWVHREEEAGNA
jgi:hypothetical protein